MAMKSREVAAVVMLTVTAGFAVVAVLAHYAFMAEYGDLTLPWFQGFIWGMTAGLGLMAGIPVVLVAVIAFVLSAVRWMRITAAVIPVIMLLGMFAVTPVALRQRVELQYSSTPQCVNEDMGGLGSAAETESQRAFDSIEHIGIFNRGGSSGDGGCDRFLVVSGDVDVLAHYRSALPGSGWEVIEDDGQHLRARHEGMAFEVVPCAAGAIVWAGREDEGLEVHCD